MKTFKKEIEQLEGLKFKPMRTIPFIENELEFNANLDRAIEILKEY